MTDPKPNLLARLSHAVAGPLLSRDVQPLEGTNASLWGALNPIANWWTENGFSGNHYPGNGLLAALLTIVAGLNLADPAVRADMALRLADVHAEPHRTDTERDIVARAIHALHTP